MSGPGYEATESSCAVSKRSVIIGMASSSALALVHCIPSFAQGTSCSFTGNPIVEFLSGPQGIKVRLVERYAFIDSSGRSWPVPRGTISDGASIPQPFWSFIGGPFEGLYRGPSIVHDYYCEIRTRKYSEVHLMFYEAMVCANVGRRRASIMHEAVKAFGPRWPDPRPRPPQCEVASDDYDFDLCTVNAQPPPVVKPSLDREALRKFIARVEAEADPGDVKALRAILERM